MPPNPTASPPPPPLPPSQPTSPAADQHRRPSLSRARSRSIGARSASGAASPIPEPKGPWQPQVAFHLSLTAAWAAIGALWLITPLSWLYMSWTLITLAPSLSSARPAHSGALQVLHYLVLSYCALEIPFSIYYRYLAYRAQARRPTPQYTRKYLRNILKRSLENGLDYSPGLGEDVLDALALGEALTRETTRDLVKEEEMQYEKVKVRASTSVIGSTATEDKDKDSFKMRKRKALGTMSTPELGKLELPKLEKGLGHSTSDDDEEEGGEESDDMDTKKGGYTPSFIQEPLERNDPRAVDFRNFLRLWFNNCAYGEIWRLNMADWLSWSLYGQPYEELVTERSTWEAAGRPSLHLEGSPDLDEEGLSIEGSKLGLVNHCVDLVEARAAQPFKPGRNARVKVIRLTLDPVRVVSRPLLLYGFVWGLQKVMIGNAMRYGFKVMRDGDTRYLVRIPQAWQPDRDCAESQRPLLFLHGLGMGLPQYATFLSYLCKSASLKERPIVILIQPSVSMSFFSSGYLKPPDQKTCTDGITRVAVRHGFDKTGFTILSHSNGTIVHAWLLKSYPELVIRSCFVDPVCFCLWEPWVCYNFLYSTPRTPIEYLMRYFVSRELGIALMLQRSFNWSANLLFPSQIPKVDSPWHSAFFLAGRDSILNADRVKSYLKRHGVGEVGEEEGVVEGKGGLKLHKENKHGESMIGAGDAFEKITEWVKCEPEFEESETEIAPSS